MRFTPFILFLLGFGLHKQPHDLQTFQIFIPTIFRADEKVVRQLMSVHMPDVCELIKESNVDISLIIVNWLLTLFSSVFPMRTLFRIWDILFLNGGITSFRVGPFFTKFNILQQ